MLSTKYPFNIHSSPLALWPYFLISVNDLILRLTFQQHSTLYQYIYIEYIHFKEWVDVGPRRRGWIILFDPVKLGLSLIPDAGPNIHGWYLSVYRYSTSAPARTGTYALEYNKLTNQQLHRIPDPWVSISIPDSAMPCYIALQLATGSQSWVWWLLYICNID